MLTCAYMTNRMDCRFEWFADSLHNETGGDYTDIRVVCVDFFAASRQITCKCPSFLHTPPKPSVWQGPHRLTTRDYFAASNARNTAICHAPDGYIAFVDDVSVLLPGWLARVRAAQSGRYVACGTYEKVRDLVVTNGIATSATHTAHGIDDRLFQAAKLSIPTDRLIPCTGSWAFGCSLAIPVQAALDVNGYDEDCDSMGAEDYPFGHMIERSGYSLFLDPNMKTLESEELHYVEPPFLRIDKPNIKGHRDGSNAYVSMLSGGRNRAPNYFGDGGLRALRERILGGEPFPITQVPQHDWRDSQPLSEM